MKLAVISHACVTPENQAFFQRVAEASGWDITILLPNAWKTDFKSDYRITRLPGFTGKLIPLPVYLKGKIPLHFYGFSLFTALLKEKPDVIYIHNEPYALSALQVAAFNLLTRRKPIGFYAAQNILKRYPLPIRLIEKFLFRCSAYGFPVTESAALPLRTKGFSKKLTVLPLGVTENHLRPPHPAAAPFTIGYVGRLVPEKGIDILVRALAQLPDPNWRCQIIGEGIQREELQSLASDLGISEKVSFLGYVGHGEIGQVMEGFSVLVLPSRSRPNWTEQFGRVLIEALAADVPVIGTECGEIPFLIRRLQGGLIVPEGDADSLAQALATLMANPAQCETFARQGRANVAAHFLESRIAEKFVGAIKEIVAAA